MGSQRHNENFIGADSISDLHILFTATSLGSVEMNEFSRRPVIQDLQV